LFEVWLTLVGLRIVGEMPQKENQRNRQGLIKIRRWNHNRLRRQGEVHYGCMTEASRIRSKRLGEDDNEDQGTPVEWNVLTTVGVKRRRHREDTWESYFPVRTLTGLLREEREKTEGK